MFFILLTLNVNDNSRYSQDYFDAQKVFPGSRQANDEEDNARSSVASSSSPLPLLLVPSLREVSILILCTCKVNKLDMSMQIFCPKFQHYSLLIGALIVNLVYVQGKLFLFYFYFLKKKFSIYSTLQIVLLCIVIYANQDVELQKLPLLRETGIVSVTLRRANTLI